MTSTTERDYTMTPLEITVTNSLYENCYNDQLNIRQLADHTGLTIKVLRGVVSSLQKKSIAEVVDNGRVNVIIVEDTDWPCDFFTPEEWDEKRAKVLKEAA
tara:strand:+ start:409 stop:711 length:303 start_codon:yes stop_codon:yes gene_type:complete